MVRKLKNNTGKSGIEPDIKKNMNNIKFGSGMIDNNTIKRNATPNENSFKSKITFDPQIAYEDQKKNEPLKINSKPNIGLRFSVGEEEKSQSNFGNINNMQETMSSFNPSSMSKPFNLGNELLNSSSFTNSSSKIEKEKGFKSTIPMNFMALKEEKEQQDNINEKQHKSFEEEEYNDFQDNKEEDEDGKEEIITINYEKINAQLKRAKELKEIIKLEEEYIENMFNIDVMATTHSKLEKLAQGLCRNALTQTFERTEFGTQSDIINYQNNHSQFNEESDEEQRNKNTTNLEIHENNKAPMSLNYQPLAYESYKFFTKFSSTIEKILLSNNQRKLLNESDNAQENQNFVKTLEFKFPENFFLYLNFSGSDKYILNYNDFIFFEMNPSIFAISYSLCFNNDNIFSNDTINLILIININSGNIDKIFYSFSRISCLCVVGEYEDLIIGGREDGVIDIFDMKPINEKFYLNFENLNKNIIFYEDSNDIKPQFYLKLPIFSTNNIHSSKVIKINTIKCENNSYKFLSIDSIGTIIIWELKDVKDIYKLDNFPIRKVKEITLETMIHCDQKLKCYSFSIVQSSKEIIYILANVGLLKISIDISDHHILYFIHNNEKESVKITAFSISDNGYLLCSYNDSCIRIIEESTNNIVYRTFIEGNDKIVFDKIYWSNVICKNKIQKVFRRDLLSNFFLISSKNDFYLFDLKKAPKKPKKKIELGSKKGLNSKNSNMIIVDSLFHDFSNLIVLSNNKTNSIEIYKLRLRNKFYEEDKVSTFNNKLIEELNKHF